MSYKVELTYFKQSGKYYGDGEYISNQEHLFMIWDELSEMFARGERPGLVNGKQFFNTLVNVPGHPHEHPYIIMSKEKE